MKKKILSDLKIAEGLAVGFLLHSCELKEDFGQQDSIDAVNYQESSGDILVLGEQKENPYSVEMAARIKHKSQGQALVPPVQCVYGHPGELQPGPVQRKGGLQDRV